MLMIITKLVEPLAQEAMQEDLDTIKELMADCYELLPNMKGE